MSNKAIIVSGPSGSGKTTIVHKLIEIPEFNLEFSISATTRKRRDNEIDGKDYYFITPEEFRTKIEENAFIEWEEVYKNYYYGTLKSEIERIFNNGKNVIFDVDVNGAINLKNYFKTNALSIFIKPPSIEELRKRLENRKTETPEKIESRIARANYELKFEKKFDKVIVNKDLNLAIEEAIQIVKDFLLSN